MWYSSDWKEYELLDAADGQRLERWGKYVFVRPDPQVVWGDKSNNPLWKKADGRYNRSNSGGGQWQFFKDLPESWTVIFYIIGGVVLAIGILGFFIIEEK